LCPAVVDTLGICAVDQGGRHVDFVTDQIITKLLNVVKRKEKKAGVTIKPFQVTSGNSGFTSFMCAMHFSLEVVEIASLLTCFCELFFLFKVTLFINQTY